MILVTDENMGLCLYIWGVKNEKNETFPGNSKKKLCFCKYKGFLT